MDVKCMQGKTWILVGQDKFVRVTIDKKNFFLFYFVYFKRYVQKEPRIY